MQQFLSKEERNILKNQHRSERDKRICDRIKAILLFDEGWSYDEIAHALLLSDEAIRKHIQEYRSNKKLQPENGGSACKLNQEQTKALLHHLEEHTYLYVKDIVAYVKAQFHVVYTIAGMTFWLKSHSFSYKMPSLVPGKANRKQQEEWLKEYYKLKQTLPETETICFMDGVHPTHNVQLACGWIKKGVRKEVPTNTGRRRLNLSGAIDVLCTKILIQEDQSLNAESTIEFLKKIESAYPNKVKIHLFCDNARYYRNQKVEQYLKRSKIEMHFLPPYSPNLNPIERLWKWMKERVLYNTYYQEYDDFKEAVIGFFTVLGNIDLDTTLGKNLRKRVRDQFSPIGA
jgi:transposase